MSAHGSGASRYLSRSDCPGGWRWRRSVTSCGMGILAAHEARSARPMRSQWPAAGKPTYTQSFESSLGSRAV
jgi:hypothetical protein